MFDVLGPSFALYVDQCMVLWLFELNHDERRLITRLIVEWIILGVDDQGMVFNRSNVLLIKIVL